MSTNVSPPIRSINPQAIASLKKLLDELKAKPSSPKPEDWNLNQLTTAKSAVIPRYGSAFSSANVGKLPREVFLGFLQFEHNLHWRGLQRHGEKLTKDMDRLREALALLVDEDKPLRKRLERLRPAGGQGMVPFLGPAVITAILHVVDPDRYGVFNNVLKDAMVKLGLWPRNLPNHQFASFPDQYESVNPIQLELALQLGIDLWTLDYLWWYVALPAAPQSQAASKSAANSDPSPTDREVPALASASPRVEASSHSFILSSGLAFSFEEAESRLKRFCREEFAYYDAIVDLVPNRVEPIDVLATVSMNAFINKNTFLASLVRSVHRGLAGRCDSLLARIPVNADLMTYDPLLTEFRDLMHAAVQTPGVLVAVATKVLHRKRRNFIPMLDSIVMKHYLTALKRLDWIERCQLKPTAADVAVEVLKAFREDLRQALPQIIALRTSLANVGFEMTPVRILEVLIWTEREPNGYYRTG
jgi:hypothetical protein